MGGKCNRRDCDGNCDFNRRALVSFLPSFLPSTLPPWLKGRAWLCLPAQPSTKPMRQQQSLGATAQREKPLFLAWLDGARNADRTFSTGSPSGVARGVCG